MFPEKIVKGLYIDPVTKTTSVVEYNGNHPHCVENQLKTYNIEYRFIENTKDDETGTTNKICLFFESNQDDLIFNKPFSVDDRVFFGAGFIVKLGEYENDRDFNTESLTKDEIMEISSIIGFNIKVNYKERVVYEVESFEEIDEVEELVV